MMSYPGNQMQNRAPGGPSTRGLGSSQTTSAFPREIEHSAAKSAEYPLGTDPDPIRIYLKGMSVVPLLTRESEVAIAQRIETGQEILLKAVSRSQPAMAELLRFGERLKNGKTGIKKLVNFNEESVTPEILEARCRKLCRHLDEIEKLNDKTLKLEPRLVGGKKRTAEDKRLRW